MPLRKWKMKLSVVIRGRIPGRIASLYKKRRTFPTQEEAYHGTLSRGGIAESHKPSEKDAPGRLGRKKIQPLGRGEIPYRKGDRIAGGKKCLRRSAWNKEWEKSVANKEECMNAWLRSREV